jgi:ketose-bisphosphate aldolase
MPLVSCKEMVQRAYQEGYAVAELNTNGGNYDLARAILETAAVLKSPVILGVYEANAEYAGLAYIGPNLRALAEEFAPDVPVAIHLDHGSSYESAVEAIQAGFTSVMYDGSKRPLQENIDATSRVCQAAHARQLTCEAELGHLLGGEADPDSPNLVSVDDVRAMTDAISIDMLAVAIGNSHGFYKGEPRLNMDRLREVRAATDVPLVLHGTTGLSEEQIRDCIRCGMAKVNLGTLLRTHYVEYYGELAAALDHGGHPWRVARAVKDRLREECAAFLGVVGSEGKAG